MLIGKFTNLNKSMLQFKPKINNYFKENDCINDIWCQQCNFTKSKVLSRL